MPDTFIHEVGHYFDECEAISEEDAFVKAWKKYRSSDMFICAAKKDPSEFFAQCFEHFYSDGRSMLKKDARTVYEKMLLVHKRFTK
jgi:hypothetical protein